jgi:nucleotide-binding universal stress UspA family protein
MKTILVPTDFSKTAENATDYAIEIAKLTKAKLVLLHVYQLPITSAETPVVYPVDQMEKDIEAILIQTKTDIYKKHGEIITVEYQLKYGFPVEEIHLYSEEIHADLIIMGMQGAGQLTEKFIGSVTTSVIKKSKHPVLVINEHIRFKNIKKIVVAFDGGEVPKPSIFEPLKELTKIFDAYIYLLNVIPEAEKIPSINTALIGIRLSHSLENVPHSFHSIINENVIAGINEFVEDKNIDMIVMIPRIHNFLKNIFQEPHTKQMAFHANTALLTLSE